MRRRAVIERGGTIYRDKQECLDHLQYMEQKKLPVHGIEIVRLGTLQAETNLYKTVWYTSQEKVYEFAATFVKEQMVGVWNYADIKV